MIVRGDDQLLAVCLSDSSVVSGNDQSVIGGKEGKGT
jgi:hypothetical protein